MDHNGNERNDNISDSQYIAHANIDVNGNDRKHSYIERSDREADDTAYTALIILYPRTAESSGPLESEQSDRGITRLT